MKLAAKLFLMSLGILIGFAKPAYAGDDFASRLEMLLMEARENALAFKNLVHDTGALDREFNNIEATIQRRRLSDREMTALAQFVDSASTPRFLPSSMSFTHNKLIAQAQNLATQALVRNPEMQNHLLLWSANYPESHPVKIKIFEQAFHQYDKAGTRFPLTYRNSRELLEWARFSNNSFFRALMPRTRIVLSSTLAKTTGIFVLAAAATSASASETDSQVQEKSINSTSQTNVGRSASFGDFGAR